MVERLRTLSVEPPKGSLSVEPMAALLVERATHPDGPNQISYNLWLHE